MTLKPRALRAWLPEPQQTPTDFPQRREEVARTNTVLKLAPKLNLIKPQCFSEVRKKKNPGLAFSGQYLFAFCLPLAARSRSSKNPLKILGFIYFFTIFFACPKPENAGMVQVHSPEISGSKSFRTALAKHLDFSILTQTKASIPCNLFSNAPTFSSVLQHCTRHPCVLRHCTLCSCILGHCTLHPCVLGHSTWHSCVCAFRALVGLIRTESNFFHSGRKSTYKLLPPQCHPTKKKKFLATWSSLHTLCRVKIKERYPQASSCVAIAVLSIYLSIKFTWSTYNLKAIHLNLMLIYSEMDSVPFFFDIPLDIHWR